MGQGDLGQSFDLDLDRSSKQSFDLSGKRSFDLSSKQSFDLDLNRSSLDSTRTFKNMRSSAEGWESFGFSEADSARGSFRDSFFRSEGNDVPSDSASSRQPVTCGAYRFLMHKRASTRAPSTARPPVGDHPGQG